MVLGSSPRYRVTGVGRVIPSMGSQILDQDWLQLKDIYGKPNELACLMTLSCTSVPLILS